MGCRLTDRWWKVLLAAVLAMGLTATGFFVGFGMASSPSSTVYSTDLQQCPTDATFCQSVNIWRRSDAAEYQPNAPENKSSALLDA